MSEQSSRAGLSPEGTQDTTEAPSQPIPEYVEALVTRARQAANRLATLSTSLKNQALLAMADALEGQTDTLLAANTEDIEAFGAAPERKAMADRLRLTESRIAEMAAGIREVAKLPDPLGEMPKMWTRPNGMQVGRVRVPIGVIGIIYESRPNVTADSAALCLKSGNACVLRGGSEAIRSNRAIAQVLSEAAEKCGIPAGVVTFVDRPDRELVPVLLKQDRWIDLIIPRGGESLMRLVSEHATIPVIKHDAGVCHVYVDDGADLSEREDSAAVHLQCHGDAVGASKYRENLAGRTHRQIGRGQGRGARMPENLRLIVHREACQRRRLWQRVSGFGAGGQGREEHRRSDGAHRSLRFSTHGSDRDGGLQESDALPSRGGCERRSGQCLDQTQ